MLLKIVGEILKPWLSGVAVSVNGSNIKKFYQEYYKFVDKRK